MKFPSAPLIHFLTTFLCSAALADEITSLTVMPAGAAFPGRNTVTLEGRGVSGMNYLVEATPDLRTWTALSDEMPASAGGALRWQHLECPGVTKRFYRFIRPPVFPAAAVRGRLTCPVAGGPCLYTTRLGWTVRIPPFSPTPVARAATSVSIFPNEKL